jgi:AcrR family transcriptional regulator
LTINPDPATAQPPRANSRQALLEAAGRIVLSEGVTRMTLEQVAREAGVSKGGLLYHFPSKEALIQAMIGHYVDHFDAAVAGSVADDPVPLGRWTRAYVRATAGELPEIDAAESRANAAITAALANFPELLEPVRDQSRRNQALIERDGLDPVTATIIRLAVDGLWLGENFDLLRLDPAMKQQVCDRLEAWTLQAPGPAGPT